MVIFGIDPAIRTTGYGVIRIVDRSFEIIDCGVITNTQKMAHSECLRRLYGGVMQICELYKPDCAVLEDPFVGRNSKTAIILGMARGGIVASLANNAIPAYSYTPSAAKRAAFGNGHAAKEQVACLLAGELGISIDDIPLDSTDALALAVCHAQKVLHPELAVEPKCL